MNYNPADILSRATRITATPERSKFCPARVEAQIGSTEYLFKYGSDCAWRLVSVSNYGNYHGVHGPGCDASGFVIRDMDVCEQLDSAFLD
jgi:hypothetical protein